MFSNKIAEDWPYKWFGFCGAEEKYLGKTYMLEDYVDTSCPPQVKEKIVSYLENAPIALAGQVPPDTCGLCEELVYPAAYRSDGIWLWPDRLPHDVEKHNFCIPNAMVKHILEQDGTPPKEIGVPWQELPWP